MNKVAVTIENGILKIWIDGCLHVAVRRSDLVGIQSWTDADRKHKFVVELITTTRSIECEYWCKSLWKQILRALNKSITL